jgi:hypothetical protein
MWETTPYKIEGALTVQVFKDGERVGTRRDVHSFDVKNGVLWVAQDKGRTVSAWAAHAWDLFKAGENLDD